MISLAMTNGKSQMTNGKSLSSDQELLPYFGGLAFDPFFAVFKNFLFPDGHSLFQAVNRIAAGFESDSAVGRSHSSGRPLPRSGWGAALCVTKGEGRRDAAPRSIKAGRPQNVPEKLCVRPFVVSVTVTSVNTTVIGGLHDGWNTAVALSVKSALPFCTGKSPAALTLVLFAAFG